MKPTVLLIVMTLTVPAFAEVFYDIDFESPIHTAGSRPATGYGIEKPSSIVFGNPRVQQGFGSMESQCLVFNQNSSSYNQIKLNLGKNRDLYFLSFDIITRNIDNSLMSFAILFDTPQVRNFYFHGLGTVSGFIPSGKVNNYRYDYNDEELMHVDATINLAQNSWMVNVNGQRALDGYFAAQNGDINSIRLNLSPWHASISNDPSAYVAIDNLYVADTVVPEPCSLLLLGLGGFILRQRIA